jgi:hypothetical protein
MEQRLKLENELRAERENLEHLRMDIRELENAFKQKEFRMMLAGGNGGGGNGRNGQQQQRREGNPAASAEDMVLRSCASEMIVLGNSVERCLRE